MQEIIWSNALLLAADSSIYYHFGKIGGALFGIGIIVVVVIAIISGNNSKKDN